MNLLSSKLGLRNRRKVVDQTNNGESKNNKNSVKNVNTTYVDIESGLTLSTECLDKNSNKTNKLMQAITFSINRIAKPMLNVKIICICLTITIFIIVLCYILYTFILKYIEIMSNAPGWIISI